jgi:outer membrane protein
MRLSQPTGIIFAAVGLLVGHAHAADLPSAAILPPAPLAVSDALPSFYVHVGPAGLIMDEGAALKVAGQKQAGATIAIKSQVTPAVELGYFVTRNLAVSFTGGIPPLAKIEAAGTMRGYPTVGKASYGPMTLTAHYHFVDLGRFQPYVGVGPAFMYVFDNNDGLLGDLKVKNTVGVAFQAGADFMINRNWGVFVDVKKALLRTTATGFLGTYPVRADVKLDPLVLSGGLTYRF